MKTLLALTTGLALAALLVPSAALAVISGSFHDFSGAEWNVTGEICVVCHTPHNAATIADAPLWNHELSDAAYTPYSSATLNAADVAQPSGVSKLCLSCHDNTVAVDSFAGATGTTFIGTLGTPAGRANVGTDLSNDHPISFTYDTALATADGELADPALDSEVADLLFNGQLECASCHDVHNVDDNAYLLRIANTGSALCLTCHLK